MHPYRRLKPPFQSPCGLIGILGVRSAIDKSASVTRRGRSNRFRWNRDVLIRFRCATRLALISCCNG